MNSVAASCSWSSLPTPLLPLSFGSRKRKRPLLKLLVFDSDSLFELISLYSVKDSFYQLSRN